MHISEIEKQVALLKYIGLAFGILALIFLLVSIIIFIKMDIFLVISEKSRKIQRKRIDKLEKSVELPEGIKAISTTKKVEQYMRPKEKVELNFSYSENLSSEETLELLEKNNTDSKVKFIIIKNNMILHSDEVI
ncbi:MAG: hypothetical protein R3Y24_09350 [Eubacteriales bacterium]